MNKGNSPERKAKMSEENIYQRLSKASGMCEKLAKANECNTGKQRYMYVSHDQYVAMIRPILIECGIVTTWDTELKDGAILVTGTFTSLDAPNDRIVSTIPIVPSRRDPAAFGAALSYAKKYCLALNLMVETGDDCDSTEEHTRNQQAQTKAQKEQADLMAKGKQLVTDLGLSDDDKNRLWLESGKDLAVYVGELEEMAQRVANDEAKELEGAGQ